jgi:uncharacterized protein (TIGR02996 family)
VRLENATDYVEVDRDDLEITIRTGRLGTRGTSRTITAKTDHDAVEAYEAALIEALRGGFQRHAGASPDVGVAERDSPIERALRDHRDDPGARMVYADYLQGQGNPVGELIALALQRGVRRDPKLEKRLAALESKLRLPLPDQAKLRWKHGMWSSLRIENAHDRQGGPAVRGNAPKAPAFHAAELARELFEHPLCSALDELVIGALNWQLNRTLTQEVIREATGRPWATDLPALVVGDCRADPDRAHYMTFYDGGKLGRAIRETFPNLRKLCVWKDLRATATETELAGLALAELTDLAIAGRTDPRRLHELESIDVPKLERLELWIGGERNEVHLRENRRPLFSIVFSGVRYPHLHHLALINSIYTNELVVDLANAPIAERLVTLDLTMGSLQDIGADTLARWRDRFPRLETVIVDQNLLTADGFGSLRGAFRTVVVGTQRPRGHRTMSPLSQSLRRSLT